jgi:hypothetical protein
MLLQTIGSYNIANSYPLEKGVPVMEETELRDTLEKLHQELEQADNLDDESRQRLQHLMGDIRTALDREETSSAEHYQSLGDQLNDAILQYEISHPSLTAAMRHALEILSGAGI